MENIEKFAELFDMLYTSFDGAELGKKVTQKMFYFYERKGISLNLRYGIHYYGPYSSKLDNILHILESEEYININTTGATHVISVKNGHSVKDVLNMQEKEIASSVIKAFAHKTPLELEALATMDFVASSMNCSSKEQIIQSFKMINGEKFSAKIINETFETLRTLELISA